MANYIYYSQPSSATIAAPQAPLLSSNFLTLAPNLVDGTAGDLTTFYQTLGTGANGALYAMVDLGAINQTVTGLQFSTGGTTVSMGVDVEVYTSNDGSTWTRYATAITYPMGTGPVSVPVSVSCRYVQLILAGATGASLSDVRVFAGAGYTAPYTILGVMTPAPTAPVAPTFNGTTTGVTSISVNTQSLTSNATSSNIQYSTDSTFATGVTTVAVTTPGSAQTITGLTSQTIYYFRIQMLGSGGTTNGPNATLKFDVTGPTFPAGSIVIPSAGTTAIVTATEFSPPITNVAAAMTLSLTGGTVTASTPVISGNTCTFTLSRTVQVGETGTASIAAGAFADTASPTPNQNAIVTALAIVNNSTATAPPTAAPAPTIVSQTATTVTVAAQALTTNATGQNLQYSTDSSFTTGVTNIYGASSTSSTVVSGLSPSVRYFFRWVEVNSGGTTTGPSAYQLTSASIQVENASVLNGQQLFVETVPGVSGPATVRLLLTQLSPDEVPDKKAHTQEGIKFPVDISEGKEYTTIKYDGTMGYHDMAYLCATCLVKPVITIPANNSAWNIAGVTGTLGFTFKGQTLVPATYTTTAQIQAALSTLSTIGTNNVVVSGTAVSPIVQFVGALSTDTSPLTVTGSTVPTIVPAATAVLTRRFTFLVDPFNPDVIQTYTLEKGILGQAGMAEIISSIYGTSMQFTVSKAEQKVNGDMVGQLDSDPATMTSTLATGNVTSVPITAKQFSVWLGDGPNNVTRLKRTQQVEFMAGDRVKPIFTLDDSQPSFSSVVEGNVSCTAKLTMVHNVQSQAVLLAMRQNAQKWLIYEALGPVIETGFQYRFKVTMPVKIMNTQKQDVDGARSAVYDLQPKFDAGLTCTAAGVPTNGGAILVEIDVPIAQLG